MAVSVSIKTPKGLALAIDEEELITACRKVAIRLMKRKGKPRGGNLIGINKVVRRRTGQYLSKLQNIVVEP